MTPDDYARARRLLLKRDPVLAALIKTHGPCGLADAQRADHFSALARAITFQQLSTKAASTIYGRVVTLMGGETPTPETFGKLTDTQLRSAGLSRQKTAYLRDLCEKVSSGALDLDALEAMDDDGVIKSLIQVKGIGRWSAEIYLLFAEGRTDVWPAGDLAVQVEIGKLLGLDGKPSEKQLRELAEAWRPHRGAVAVLAWHSYNSEVI